jgi:hypothetical protein
MSAAVSIQGGGGPIVQSVVSLWEAGPSAPTKLAETQTKDDGSFSVQADAGNGVLCLIAKGGEPKAGPGAGANPAISLIATLGTAPPKQNHHRRRHRSRR